MTGIQSLCPLPLQASARPRAAPPRRARPEHLMEACDEDTLCTMSPADR